MNKWGKIGLKGIKGQVTIFVIIAIVIVGAIVLLFVFPKVNIFVGDVNG